MLGADAKTLAIHDHRTGECQTQHFCIRHRGEKNGRSGIVGRRIVGQIADIDTEPDFRCQMHHGIDTAQRQIDGLAVADITLLKFDARRLSPLSLGMHIEPKRIQHADLVSARLQLPQDMVADKPRPSCQQYHHGGVRSVAVAVGIAFA